jgi:small-conductance mechanosensitive channel
MKLDRYHLKTIISLAAWILAVVGAVVLDQVFPEAYVLSSGRNVFGVVALLVGMLAAAELLSLVTVWVLAARNSPPSEAEMVGRLYQLAAIIAVVMGIAYGFGKLATFGTFFSLFGGMLLGWSLQAPVSGFAAWILVSLKRPFRPGDRIQFPNLGLTGDVKETGLMYTYLNQVGGTVGSEEAVGRYILVPNAMLFSQVVINYTVLQESPYMLDEVLIRITYDTDWDVSERILLNAAREMTSDIIEATQMEPYIRADQYDYGVYLRLRYQTRVKDRAEISYRITKSVFEKIQMAPEVDLAIPFVYSYRAGMRAGTDRKEEIAAAAGAARTREIQGIEIDSIKSMLQPEDTKEIAEAARSMSPEWLRQPIVVSKPQDGFYTIVAGHLQFEICKYLGWKTISAIVVDRQAEEKAAEKPAIEVVR